MEKAASEVAQSDRHAASDAWRVAEEKRTWNRIWRYEEGREGGMQLKGERRKSSGASSPLCSATTSLREAAAKSSSASKRALAAL